MNTAMKTRKINQLLLSVPGIMLFMALITGPALAQQIPNFSLYNMNHYLVNPAATGINTQVTPDMGIGARIFNYQAGPLRKTGLEATYSYHIDLGSDSKLSFGLSLLLYQFKLSKSEMTHQDITDEVFMGDEQMFVPDAGIGAYYYGPKYYVGLAVPQLFQRNIDLKSDAILQQKQVRHYYLHGGYVFDVGTDFKIEPSALLKFVESGIFQADINALVTYKDMVNFGLSFRSSEALSFQLGYKNPDIFIGYAYDLILSGMRGNTWGSHEILFTYTLDNFLLK
jgi:type IX secretion system PorP/SprF family membrane protein